MKVTNDSNTQLNPGTRINKASSQTDLGALLGDEVELDGLSEKTSFASVLDRVTQSRKETGSQHTQKHSDGPAAPAETKPRELDETEEATTPVLGNSSTPSEPVVKTEMSTDIRAMLPAVDLDSIVAACRVQVAAGGQREVVIDLSHSVLDGLRVKLSADSAGRIATEFLAANEGVKSLLDSRSPELVALLRSRGINLTTFKSSVAADANSGGDSRSGQNHDNKLEGIGESRAASSTAESESDRGATDDLAIGATYRA